ncbi:hypothetical protein [Sphaerisporangium rhizosphaerae]|uniref:WD40 repeat domain-containing protein n=1 Tax=Sphaerisporangium rhizosphaerae TaxID=2269375 RepID=A0ABW2P374_9ACTN
MKRTRTMALLAMAAMATATALTGPAEAFTGAASTAKTRETTHTTHTTNTASGKAVRYAWVASCAKGDYVTPCGSWTLSLRDGKTVKVPEATVYPRGADGRPDKESSAPFAVSGDGSRVVYFRRSDHKLVWKDVASGRSHGLPGSSAKLPKRLGMEDVAATLSHDGDTVVVDYGDASGKLPTLVVHLRSGEVVKLPGKDDVQGFSPDGRRVLLSRTTADNTTEFTVYDTDGQAGESREVPQVVSNNSPIALADDGVTVGVVIVPTSGRPRLRLYDLSTDAVSPAVDLNVPSSESPYRLDWDESGKLTLWRLRSSDDGTLTRVTASRVDPSDGALKKIDSFRVRGKIYTWWLPGE